MTRINFFYKLSIISSLINVLFDVVIEFIEKEKGENDGKTKEEF